MFQHRFISAAAAVALCGALIAPVGCKKKEEAKPAAAAAAEPAKKDEPVKVEEKAAPAAPVLPDVELQAGDGVVGWLSFKSFTSLFDAIESVGGKLGAIPPGGSMRGQVTAGITAVMAQAGVKDIAWIDMSRPIHIGYHDQPAAAAPGAAPAAPNQMEMASGVFLVLPVTGKDAAKAAMATAKTGAEAEGHEAMLTSPKGEKIYFDFLDKFAVITVMDKDRFAKIKGFAERISKVEPPAVAYFGMSIDDLMKTRKAEVDSFLKMMEDKGNDVGGGANPQLNAQVMGTYMKMIRTWTNDASRFELLLAGDPANLRLEVRMQAHDGSKFDKQLKAGRGRTTAAIAGLLPSNSYLTVAASADPAASMDSMDDALVMLKEAFKMDAAAFDALAKDMKELAKLQDGNSAVGFYPDGPAAIGMLMAAGTTDGAASVKVGKRVLAGVIGQVMAMAKADQAAKGKKESPEEAELMAAFDQALKEGKLDAVLAKVGPKAEAAGVKLTTNTTTEGEITCDILDVAIDYSKMPPDSAKVKELMGDKLAVALCAGKAKIGFAFGAGALEKAKAAAAGKAGGLTDSPAYKAAVGSNDGSTVFYLNPGAALAAFKSLVPPGLNIPGDKAVLFSCGNRAKSFACGLDVPVDLIKSGMDAARGPGAAPAAAHDEEAAPTPPPAPGPTGGAPAAAPAPAVAPGARPVQ